MKLPDREMLQWYLPTAEAEAVVCVSDGETWVSHWDPNFLRTRRCGGRGCVLCADGSKPIRRYVFLVEDRRGVRFLLELRDSHRDAIELANDPLVGCVGARFVLRRDGDAKRGRVFCFFDGREDGVHACSIVRLVADLGLPALVFEENRAHNL